MTEEKLEGLSDLEREFRKEQKGYGSISPYLVGDGRTYVGYDIHPENIEALYFEGIGVPRWETFSEDSVEKSEALYMEQYQKLMSDYPMIARANDTEQAVQYSPDEVSVLIAECDRVMSMTTDPKAQRAVQKLSLAASKALDKQTALELIPRSEH
jgi:hypothetical protein